MSELIDGAPQGAGEYAADVCEPNFYLIPFASQMVIWATRRRLHEMYRGAGSDDQVAHVFHMASWSEIYASLLTATQVLATAARGGPLRLHSIGCSRLEYYEARWLNALACLQFDQRPEATDHLKAVLTPAGVRLALPHLQLIAENLQQQKLRIRPVRLTSFAEHRRIESAARAHVRFH